MSFEFISNPTARYNNFEFGRNLLKTSTESSGYLYQPNFVLINQKSIGQAISMFGDILPVYSSSRELTNIIVTSWESLSNLVILSRTFLVCLLSFLNSVIHNTVYQAYTLMMSAYGQVLLLPERYSHVQNKLENLIKIFATDQGRELWWLEVKIDLKQVLNKAYTLINLIFEVSKKFYLAWVIFLVIGFLNYSAVFSSLSSTPNSFLSKFIQNYSLSATAAPVLDIDTDTSTLSTSYISSSIPQIQAITEYQVEDGDNVEQIAYNFGVSTDTLKLNNPIKEDVEIGQKLYIPWVDGYIFNASKDITPQELEKIYSIPATSIQDQNVSIFDTQLGGFHKDALILIPTSEFAKIDQGNKFLEAQKQSIELSKRSKKLSENSITYKKSIPATTKNTTKVATSTNFIWPTTGNISRCFSSGHHGCDIANFAAPAINAVKKGVVKVGYEAGGYGNYVKIDHGNGIVTVYAHMKKVYVSSGQIVDQGEAIGQMGQTGRSTGIHLHFEVQVNGVQVDPLGYLPSR
jgi:murein DD-endopeptidase MepM/ murein hydrolase activator NlpD